MKLTIDEYSKKFKMSKEMISSKIRTKKLNHIVENGTTYILLEPSPSEVKTKTIVKATAPAPVRTTKTRTTVATVLGLYQRENTQLKNKIVQLEEKIDKLINDKEQMLRDERDRIEEVYSAKDEQLKSILKLPLL